MKLNSKKPSTYWIPVSSVLKRGLKISQVRAGLITMFQGASAVNKSFL